MKRPVALTLGPALTMREPRDKFRVTAAAYKLAATVQAKAALAGVRVESIEADDGALVWFVSRWSLTRQCDSLDDVRALLARMGIEA
jgi:hypothetical protein